MERASHFPQGGRNVRPDQSFLLLFSFFLLSILAERVSRVRKDKTRWRMIAHCIAFRNLGQTDLSESYKDFIHNFYSRNLSESNLLMSVREIFFLKI